MDQIRGLEVKALEVKGRQLYHLPSWLFDQKQAAVSRDGGGAAWPGLSAQDYGGV